MSRIKFVKKAYIAFSYDYERPYPRIPDQGRYADWLYLFYHAALLKNIQN